MKNAAIVRRLETAADLDCHAQCLVLSEPADPPQQRGEIFSLDMLHRNEVTPIDFADIEDPADVRMCNLPRQPNFVEEQLQATVVAGILAAQKLECDSDIEREILCLIDDAHAAAAEMADDAVPVGDEGT